MPAYVIVDVNIHDAALYEEYKHLTPDTIADYNGKFVVRGPQIENLEGAWPDNRLVILEFPSVARAKQWWNSPGYAAAKAIRHRTATTNMIVVEGV